MSVAEDLAEERLREEFDLLCLPQPDARRVAEARRGARIDLRGGGRGAD